MQDAFEKVFNNKKRVLIVTAHPDDAEIFAGGTMARLIASGIQVRSVKVSSGECGSRQEQITQEELKKTRVQEDKASMKLLGLKDEDTVYLDCGDGKIEDNLDIIGKIAFQIREFKPDLIITHNPEDVIIRFAKDVNWINHRDHRNTGIVTTYAAYPYSRDNLFYPEQLKEVSPHICSEFLFVDYYDHPDVVGIEVTDFVEKRIQAHASHASQYTVEHAKDSADFFTLQPDGKRFETFRYVIAD